MAQQNPINKTAGLSSTGSTHSPLSTSSTYTSQTTSPTHNTNPATSTSTSDPRSTGQKVKDLFHDDSTGTSHTNTNTTQTSGGRGTNQGVKQAASSVGGVFAAVHGAGEKIRGEFNAGVDRTFNEPEGEVKNANVAAAGDREIDTGHFAGSTKARELGDGGRRV